MELIEWREDLEVGHPMIDADHQRLVMMMNTLLEAVLEDRGEDVLGEILDGLVVYARTHFAREEKEMRLHHYPDMTAHIREHARFIHEISGFQIRFRAGDTALSLGLIRFLRVWLIDHILTVDRRLADYLHDGTGENAAP